MPFWKKSKVREDKTKNKDETDTQAHFPCPWRTIQWAKKAEIMEELKIFSVSNPEMKCLRLMLVGPIGAGKSSFFNSVNSVFQNRITNRAIAATSSDTSCTKSFRAFKIKNGDSETLPFVLYDTMGLEGDKECGVLPADLNTALYGSLPEGHKFNPLRSLKPEDAGYISEPKEEEKIHCMICVVSGNSISQMPKEIIEKMRGTIKEASDLGVTQVVIMTMIDKVCPLVESDLKNVYISKKIKEKMQECSETLAVPMTCIFPVKNYHEKMENNNDMDVLILSALKQILHFANDFAEKL